MIGSAIDLGNPIDRSHPLARSLRDCVLFGGLGMARNHNLASNVPGGYRNAPAWATADGLQGVYATGGACATVAEGGNLAAGDLTCRLVFKPLSWSTTYHIAVIKDTGSCEIRWAFNTSGDISYTQVGNTESFTGVSTGCAAGKVWDVVMTRTAGAGTVQYYVNGQPVTTGFTLTGTSARAGLTYLGYAADGNANMDAVYLSWQTWTRVLSASEVRWLYADPRAMLRRIPRRAWMFGGTAAAPGGGNRRRRLILCGGS